MKHFPIALLGLALATGCSPSSGPESSRDMAAPAAMDVAGDAADAAKSAGSGDQPDAVTVTLPQLAYVYTLGFRLPADKIEAAQKAHTALCDKLGPARCQMVSVSLNGDGATGGGRMKLRVATPQARAFAAALQKAVADQGGRQIDADVAAEDVSKDMVDAQARIAQRTLLVERLTEILRTRDGKVGELVEAERSVAQAQEELDQAKAWLAELRGRVATSTFDLSYDAIAPTAGSTLSFGEAFQGSGSAFLTGLRVIGVTLVYLAPWLLLLGLLIAAARFAQARLRKPKADEADTPAHD